MIRAEILNRDEASAEVEARFGPALQLPRDVANYGTNLIVRCFDSSENEIVDVIGVMVFGKQVVSCLDGVEQLAGTGSGVPAHLTARALIEASIDCRWVLSEEAKFYDIEMPEETVMQLQERVFTSPIWYAP